MLWCPKWFYFGLKDKMAPHNIWVGEQIYFLNKELIKVFKKSDLLMDSATAH